MLYSPYICTSSGDLVAHPAGQSPKVWHPVPRLGADMYSFVISANSSPMYKKPNGFSFYRRRDFGVIQVAIGQHSLGTPVGQPLEEVAYCPRGIDPRPQLQNTARQVLVLFHQMLRRAFATTQLASGQIGGCAAYGSSSRGRRSSVRAFL